MRKKNLQRLKFLFACIGIQLCFACASGPTRCLTKEERMKAAETHYLSGCYTSAVQACGYIKIEDDREDCFEKMNHDCPGMAKTFRKFLEPGN